MTKYFSNYEVIKLDIIQPNYLNFLIFFLFIVLIIFTTKKNNISFNNSKFLSVLHTDQLRGVAIFFVILGHLWVHVSKNKPLLIFSGNSVSFFLFLSGFGLAISTKSKTYLSFKDFILKRIRRVMIPYWVVTIIILILDYLILNRKLEIESLLFTVIGINIRIELMHLDYARWFVTFILLWYLIFYMFFLKLKVRFPSFCLLIIAFFMLLLDYYVWNFKWYNFFSFPIGCLIATHYERVVEFCNKNMRSLAALSIIIIFYVIFYKLLMSDQDINFFLIKFIPNILFVYINEINSIIFVLSFILFTTKLVANGFSSTFLLFLGKYSYEIFLLHGVFLIKYNPIINGIGKFTLCFQFFLFIFFIVIISFLTHKIHIFFYEKKST